MIAAYILRKLAVACALAIYVAPTPGATPLGQAADGPAFRLEVVQGEGAVNNVKGRVAREPVVRVVDRNNKPVAGAAVAFILPHTGASGTFVGGSTMLNVITNAQGLASATGLSTNAAAGTFNISVVASFQGHTATVAIAQTNAALGAAAGGAAGGAGTVAGSGAGAATGATGVSMGVVAAVGAAVAGAVIAGLAATGGGDQDRLTTNADKSPPSPAAITFTIGAPRINAPRP